MVGCPDTVCDSLDACRAPVSTPESHYQMFDRLVVCEIETAVEESVSVQGAAQARGLSGLDPAGSSNGPDTVSVRIAEDSLVRVEERGQSGVEKVTPLGRKFSHRHGDWGHHEA